jgi:hypothetical protein
LVDGKHPIIYRVSTILLVVQDFATIPRYHHIKTIDISFISHRYPICPI